MHVNQHILMFVSLLALLLVTGAAHADNTFAVLTTAELKQLLDQGGKIMVVDARNPEEYQEGHIPGAINIPVADFAAQSDQLDKKKTIVVTCNSGGRSYIAYRKLMKLGYEKNSQAIFQDWQDQGLSVETAAN